MILRLFGWRGIAGLTLAAALAVLLLIQIGETRHWRRQSNHYEQLHRAGEAALAGTIANYRAAADRARAADQANLGRVAAVQTAITERTADDYQSRVAAARANARAHADATRLERLRLQAATPAGSDPGIRRAASVPGLPLAAVSFAQAAGENRLPAEPSLTIGTTDALIATEQAIQLDELIKWLRRQQAVNLSGAATSDGKR